MYIRVPRDVEAPFEREIRRKRFRLYVAAYPILVVLLSAFVVAKAHALFRLTALLSHSDQAEGPGFTAGVAATTAIIAVGALLALRHVARKPLLREYPYCPRCDALDFDEAGTCPCCSAALGEKARFLFTIQDSEMEIAKKYGLSESRKS